MNDKSSPHNARRWAASSSSSPQLTLNLHGSLPVRLIATPRRSFKTCCTGEDLSDVVANNVESFDHLPVIDASQDDVETIVGLLDVRSLGSEERLQATVRERMNPLSEQLLIGADASILDFMMMADRQRCRLVVSESEISGLVSLSDLQRLPVRAALFALITQSEITMADAIRRECRDPHKEFDTWMNRLSVDRQNKIHDEIGRSTDEDGFVDSLLFTQYGDKVTILRKSPRFQWSKTKFKSDMRNVESLRDQIAHANDYASTPVAAEQVCSTVRSLHCWNRRLASWPNCSVPDRDF